MTDVSIQHCLDLTAYFNTAQNFPNAHYEATNWKQVLINPLGLMAPLAVHKG